MSSHVFIWRVLALIWAGKIFWFSTSTFGGNVSRPLLESLLDLLQISVSTSTLEILHVILRKLAHVVEYAILSFLLYRSLGGQARWKPHLAGWAIVVAAAYSLTDEFHQSFVRERGASLLDCSIDTAGAVLAMLLVYIGSRVSERNSRRRPLVRISSTVTD